MKIFKTLNFNPTNINLYYEAFTHTSYSNENPSFTSYERLEFLGDAILEFIISDYLYKERHLTEGVMTKMIIETCLLTDEEIRVACELCTEAGIDWVKSSTGQYAGPTLEQVRLMVQCCEGTKTKVKVSGVKDPRPQNA